MNQTLVMPVLYFLSAIWLLFVPQVALIFGVVSCFCLCVFFSEDFIVVFVNDLACSLFGYTRERMGLPWLGAVWFILDTFEMWFLRCDVFNFEPGPHSIIIGTIL